MAKRSSGQFERHANDLYDTPFDAVLPLLPFLRRHSIRTFAEPCYGNGFLIRHLRKLGLDCVFQCDIREGAEGDALIQPHFGGAQNIITNPPWTRTILHAMIAHFMAKAPTWLLFEADWAQTMQAQTFMRHCTHIVAVGRVRWIEGTANDGKDNASWYRFNANHTGGPRFYNQRPSRRGASAVYAKVRFTAADDREMRAMLEDGQGIKAIARALGRAPSSVRYRMELLGLQAPYDLRAAA